MLIGVSASFDCNTRLDEFLVVFAKEISPGRIIRKAVKRQYCAENGDQALDDELRTRIY